MQNDTMAEMPTEYIAADAAKIIAHALYPRKVRNCPAAPAQFTRYVETEKAAGRRLSYSACKQLIPSNEPDVIAERLANHLIVILKNVLSDAFADSLPAYYMALEIIHDEAQHTAVTPSKALQSLGGGLTDYFKKVFQMNPDNFGRMLVDVDRPFLSTLFETPFLFTRLDHPYPLIQFVVYCFSMRATSLDEKPLIMGLQTMLGTCLSKCVTDVTINHSWVNANGLTETMCTAELIAAFFSIEKLNSLAIITQGERQFFYEWILTPEIVSGALQVHLPESITPEAYRTAIFKAVERHDRQHPDRAPILNKAVKAWFECIPPAERATTAASYLQRYIEGYAGLLGEDLAHLPLNMATRFNGGLKTLLAHAEAEVVESFCNSYLQAANFELLATILAVTPKDKLSDAFYNKFSAGDERALKHAVTKHAPAASKNADPKKALRKAMTKHILHPASKLPITDRRHYRAVKCVNALGTDEQYALAKIFRARHDHKDKNSRTMKKFAEHCGQTYPNLFKPAGRHNLPFMKIPETAQAYPIGADVFKDTYQAAHLVKS